MAVLWGSAVTLAATTIFPLDQIKAGLKGKGKTVFVGTASEEFDVEILGILSNPNPKRSIIIARLSGHKALEGGGVIAGMSGSPVYIDGKIVGAVAYGFPFSKEPIAGITPIEEMLAIVTEPAKPPSSSAPSIPFTQKMTIDDLLSLRGPRLGAVPAASFNGSTISPLKVPLVLGGFSSSAADHVRSALGPLGFLPLLAGGKATVQDKTLQADLSVREGDALALQLVTGDLDVSAVGTATYVDGDKVLAFGHPLYNLGGVSYGMARAKVITVLSVLDNPSKMATSGGLIGTFIQDRTAGALGIIGRPPKFVPVNVNLIGEGTTLREFKLQIVSDKLLTPLLINMAVSSLLSGEERSVGDLTLELQADLYLDNGTSIHLENLYSANLGSAVSDLSGLVTAVVYFLTNNEFGDVGLHRVDLNVRAIEGIRQARLERVWLDKYEAAPGETLTIRVYYRSYRGETQVEEVPFSTPRLPAGSEFQIVVGDAASMAQVESGQYRARGVTPRSLAQVIRLLGNLRKNNRIYFKVLTSKPGLFLHGEELPNLPPGLKSMFTSPRAAASSPTELSTSTLTEYQMPVPYVFSGLAIIPVKIRK